MQKGSDGLKFEVTKFANSKIKDKIVAVLVSDTEGIRFAELLAQVSGIEVKTYNFSKSKELDSMNSTIRDLNNDSNVVLIINTTDETVDIFIQKMKRCSHNINKNLLLKNSAISLFDLKYKMQLIEVDKFIRKWIACSSLVWD